MQDFHQLNVWQRAHSLVLRIYQVSSDLPEGENFSLVLNLRRSSMSVARFIAEGCGRDTDAEFSGDLKKARAALFELEYLVLVCRDLGFFSTSRHDELAAEIIEVRKMIAGLLKRLVTTPEPLR